MAASGATVTATTTATTTTTTTTTATEPQSAAPIASRAPRRAHIIVFGNAKGGAGKSTTAMHVLARLLAMGHRVAAIDLDGRQQTLARYIENRRTFVARHGAELAVPAVTVVDPCRAADGAAGVREGHAALHAALANIVFEHDFVIVDCPGNDDPVVRHAHSVADTLVTPLNDSFLDFDVLGRVDEAAVGHKGGRVAAPGWYAEIVWEQRKRRFAQDQHEIDWVVLRNRTSHIDSRNRQRVSRLLAKLAATIGFREVPGLSDRVIYRELFPHGLTLSDLRGLGHIVDVTMTHIAAHQEVRDLVAALALPEREASGSGAPDAVADSPGAGGEAR